MRVLVMVVLAALSMAACGEETLLVDPLVRFTDRNVQPPSGPISLQLGRYSEQFFEPLSAGDELEIINGFQGGTWVMPAVQCTGLGSDVDVSGEVVTVDGERVGILTPGPMRLDRNPEGVLEANSIPIPILHEEDPSASIRDLFGVEATLKITLEDTFGNRVEDTLAIVLTGG